MARPKKLLTVAQIKQLPKLAYHGLNLEQIADLFEICDDTLRIRMKEDESILRAYKKAKAEAAAMVTSNLIKLIKGGDKASIFFYCKTQLGWRETQGVDVTSGDQPLEAIQIYLPENARNGD